MYYVPCCEHRGSGIGGALFTGVLMAGALGLGMLIESHRDAKKQAAAKLDANGNPVNPYAMTFEKVKAMTFPSSSGLYVPEILALSYVKDKKYPLDEYPTFWQEKYGIADVNEMLTSLATRGYIVMEPVQDALAELDDDSLKFLLRETGHPDTGMREDMLKRAQMLIPPEKITEYGCKTKYKLTQKGEQELENNAYVPFMDSYPYCNSIALPGIPPFDIWTVNLDVFKNPNFDWKKKAEEHSALITPDFATELQKAKEAQQHQTVTDIIHKENEQRQQCIEALRKYQKDHDIDAYIAFWEDLWENTGLLFVDSKWLFVLPDLYIEQKRYEDALKFCQIYERVYKDYDFKFDYYIHRIQMLSEKDQKVRSEMFGNPGLI